MGAKLDKLLLRWVADVLHWYVHKDDKKKPPVVEPKEEGGEVGPPPLPPEVNTGRDEPPIDSP